MNSHNPLLRWIDRNILELGREMRLSYLPPLMVYLAAGISGLTGIVGTFYVKEYLGLTAEFLAALGFWAGLPWALKMPLGHLIDLLWRWKSGFVYLGAALIAASLAIMIGLLSDPAAMRTLMSAEAWFVLSTLLAPIGFALQDAVADAMTVEAVPRVDAEGKPIPDEQRKLMNTTMQTLGRVAIIGGTVLVALLNVVLLAGVGDLPEAGRTAAYRDVHLYALAIPLVSVLGVLFAAALRRRTVRGLAAQGFAPGEIEAMLAARDAPPPINWWIIGGGLLFAGLSLSVGLGGVPNAEEIVFGGSLAIVLFMMQRLVRELEPEARRTLVGTALVIFVFRAVPLPGAGATWWQIDELGFDPSFLATLSVVSSVLTLAGLFVFRRFMAEHSISYVVGALTVLTTLLALPTVGMYYGLHEWTARLTGGVIDARAITLVNTALESPLGQVAMVPMLAWIANSAPTRLKATFFAVMASFTNLALSASQLATKYLNQLWSVTREVRDPASGALRVPADYSQLGELLIATVVIGFAAPFLAILLVRTLRLRSG
jgi:hypothetical protein